MSGNTLNIQLPFTTSHAFIIGIDDYQHVSPLQTAVNDAKAIAQRLEDQHGFTVHAPALNVGYKELQKLVTETIPKLVQEDDRILFYFAGHGIALDSEEGPNGYIVAADTKPGNEDTLIPMNDLHDALTGLPCRHGLLILDCCFSGAFKWSSGFRDVIFDLPKVIYEERFWRYCKDPAWQVITSAAHDQKAVDILTNQSLGLREDKGGDNSPFAASLLQALDGAGDTVPAGSGDGVMTATELYAYLRDSVETTTTENAKRQSPSIFNLKRHGKGEFIFLNPNHRFNLPPTPDRNPFMGLSSYNETDASLFYGRDRVVEALLRKVGSHPLVVVSGASGTGKSSVIKAGVLPALRHQEYTILPIIRPGKEPMKTLRTGLPSIPPREGLPPLIPPSRGGIEGSSVLVIDQYEELITQCLHPEERTEFEQQLATWLQQHPRLRILLSIRSDFEPQFESQALRQWWSGGRFVVPAFSLEEIREVITKPAAQAVLFYEPDDLVEQLSEEVSQAPGALPLLSFTLSELYHAYLRSGREDRALTEADYQQLGGVIGALRTRADAEYEALSRAEQSSMRKLMLRMVSLEGGELAGKRIFAEELQFSDAAESTRLQKIADRLVEARLLLKGTDAQGQTYVEPAHDALVRAWGRLWEWIKAVGEEKISLQYKLSQAVMDYHSLLTTDPKKARNLLWNSNPRLDLLRAELEGKEHGLNKQEEDFVRSSVKRRTTRTRTAWAIAIGVMVGLAGLSIVALNQQRIAKANEQTALQNEELAKQRAQEVQDSAKEAALQRLRANEEATRAVSNSLASRSILAEQSDPTAALRIAELALEYDPNNTNALGAMLTAYYREDLPLIDYFYTIDPSFSKPVAPDPERKRQIIGAIIGENNYYYQGENPEEITVSTNGAYVLRRTDAEVVEGPRKAYRIQVQSANCGEAGATSNKYTLDDNGFQNAGLTYYPAAFSPDNEFALTPNGNRVDILRIENGCELALSDAVGGPVAAQWAVFASNGGRVVAGTRTGTNYSWDLENSITALIQDQNYFLDNTNMYRVFCDASEDQFVFVRGRFDDLSEIDRRDANGEVMAYPGAEQLLFSRNDMALVSGSQQVFDLTEFVDLFNLEEKVMLTPASAARYEVQISDDHAVQITDRDNGRRLALNGHLEAPEWISFDPEGQFIVSSSAGEIKFWDWRGYNFFSLNFGGPTRLLPSGKKLIYWEQVRPRRHMFAYRAVRLIDIDPESILQKINTRGIHQLTENDKLIYGIEQ